MAKKQPKGKKPGKANAPKPGRPTELTPAVQRDICTQIMTGQNFNTACELAGISVKTAESWMRRGKGTSERSQEEIYVGFVAAIKSAKVRAKAYHVTQIVSAGKKHWTASAWWLERNYPEEYGRHVKIEGQVETTAKQVIRFGEKEVEF